jgi:DNA-binding response OmpR family regulator
LFKLLLVEDESNLARAIIRELRRAGCEVLHAGDGLAALELHASQQPDAIILDWMLPQLYGLEVLRRIRQTAATPVLMLTARDEVVARVVGLEAGADDYPTKPFSMRELVARCELCSGGPTSSGECCRRIVTSLSRQSAGARSCSIPRHTW